VIGPDLRFIVRDPKFSIPAILMLAVGVGLSGICYAVLEAAVFNAIPYDAPSRLVEIGRGGRLLEAARWRLTKADFESLRNSANWFEEIGYEVDSAGFISSDSGAPTPVGKAAISPRLLNVFRVKPLLGRAFLPEDFDAAAPGTVLLSYSLWSQVFSSDPAVLGKPVTVDGTRAIVVGIMPKSMRLPVATAGLWLPDRRSGLDDETSGDKLVVARLRGAVSLQQAQRDSELLEVKSLPGLSRTATDNDRYRVVSLVDQLVGKTSRILNLLLAACLLLQVAACFNVGHLMVARRLRRAGDLGVQLALGSGMGRIYRNVVFEAGAIAAAGIAVAVPVIVAALPGAGVLASNVLSAEVHPELSLSVLAFGSALAAVSTLICAAGPILVLRRIEVISLIGRRWQTGELSVSASRLQDALVVLQVSIAVLLAVTLGVLLRGVYRLSNVDLGFQAESVSYISFDGGKTRLPESAVLLDEALRRLSQLPGVASAAVGSTPLLAGGRVVYAVSVKTAQGWVNTPPAAYQSVSDAYFATLGIPFLKGRAFDRRDVPAGQCVAIVNRAFASSYWPGADAVGAEIDFSGGFGARRLCTIVGVVADSRSVGLSSPPEPEFFRSFRQIRASANTVVIVRTAQKKSVSLAAVRRVVTEIDPTQRADFSTDIGSMVRSALMPAGTRAKLLGAIALCVFLLAAGGMYATASYHLGERAREIGIRMAMGASPFDIAILVYRRYAALAGLGGLLGGIAGIAFTRQAAASLLLSPSQAIDGLALLAAPLTCTLIVLASVAIPTVRAATVNPSDLFRDAAH
jgi:predicted permease